MLFRFVQEKAGGGQTFSKRRYMSGGCSSQLSVLLWFFSVIRSEIVAGAEH